MPRRCLPASLSSGLAAAILLLAGCATSSEPEATPATPAAPMGPSAPVPAAKPAKPAVAPVVQLKPATITGSEESSTMFDNFTAYVRAVDGETVAAGRTGWNTRLALKPGPRRLSIAFIRGAFTAQMDVQFNASPAAAYQLKYATDAHIFGNNSYCEFWIEDTATGEKVVSPVRMPLTKLDTLK